MDNYHQKKDFGNLVKKAQEACGNISDNFFNVQFAGDHITHYRERVYAYEFYHQLRCLLTDNYAYDVSAEMDKRLNPLFRQKGMPLTIPDLIVHKAGESINLAILEIKSGSNQNRGGRTTKDLNKIKIFIEKVSYYGGIELVYGEKESLNKGMELILKGCQELMKLYKDNRIVILIHPKPNEPAYEFKLQ